MWSEVAWKARRELSRQYPYCQITDGGHPPTRNKHLLRWVEKMAELAGPTAIHWVDGSQQEYDRLCEQLVASGTFLRLNQQRRPGCFYARSDPSDVARVEERTFICSLSKDNAGPTNNWEDPREMRRKIKSLFRGAMQGRTMYVLPFSMGPIGSKFSQIGVQLTDSPYVVVSMRIMARIGLPVFAEIDRDEKRVVPCMHSVGAPLQVGTAGRPMALQQGKIHRPFSRDPRNLVLSDRVTEAMLCWARSALPSASPPTWRGTKAGWPSTC